MLHRKMNGDDFYNIDQKIRAFCKVHRTPLSKREHRQLRRMLNKRAAAASDILGVKISSVCGK